MCETKKREREKGVRRVKRGSSPSEIRYSGSKEWVQGPRVTNIKTRGEVKFDFSRKVSGQLV